MLHLTTRPVTTPERGATGHHQRNLQRTPDTGNAADVIAVLVGHQHRIERTQFQSDSRCTGRQLAHAKATVHQHPGATTLDNDGIAVATATQNRVPEPAQLFVSVPYIMGNGRTLSPPADIRAAPCLLTSSIRITACKGT